MTMNAHTTFRLSDQQISSDLSGEKVILNHKKGAYYGLNEVGATLWSVLEKGPATFSELIHAVQEVYDIDTTTLEVDLKNLLSDLIKEKLLEQIS